MDDIILKHAPELASQLLASAANRKTEAELVHDTVATLREFASEANLPWNALHERRIVFRTPDAAGQRSARADFLFNLVVVEFEPPRSLYNNNQATKNKHAINQVKQQIDGLHSTEHLDREKISGVVLDGRYFIFCRYSQGRWIEEAPLDVDGHSATRFLRLLASLQRQPLLPHLIAGRFGIEQEDTAVGTIRAFYDALKSPSSPRSIALRAQWMDFYSDVAGLDVNKLAANPELQKFAVRVTQTKGVNGDELANLLFALYTYGAVLMKFLAVAAVTPFFADKVSEPLAHIAKLDDSKTQELQARLHEIESGAYFRDLKIRNLCEGDFFGWYVDEWTPSISRQIKRMLDVLTEYDPTVVEQTPERVRDLMKRIYHSLLPKAVRKVLGEYYTPDWLAERTLMLLDNNIFGDSPNIGRDTRAQLLREVLVPALTEKRFLDPTCGSGTFLVLILSRLKLIYGEARQLTTEQGEGDFDVPSRKQFLKCILRNVIGFDLNPLAVIASRVNYLLAIVDLIAAADEEVEIPVYLADSIALPAEGTDGLFSNGVYQLPMRGIGQTFPVPEALAKRAELGKLAQQLETDVTSGAPVEAFLRSCRANFDLPGDQWTRAEPALRELYGKLDTLQREGRNGLWASVAKNMFMPLFTSNIDYVVGNPPWVNWEGLPEAYRQSTISLWKEMGLFVHTGMDVMLGKGKKDISTLCSYVASDRYLKVGGKLAFVITQSVFKTTGAGQGFRRFQIGAKDTLRVLAVDDYTSFQPFEDASNRTAVFVWQKGSQTQYPLNNYGEWKRVGRQKPDFWATWAEAFPLLERRLLSAEPVDRTDVTSSWLTASRKVLGGLRKVLGASEYVAHAGAYSGGCNPVYWLEILRRNNDGTVDVQMMTEGAKKEVPGPHRHTIEPDYLHPLLRGRDVKKWNVDLDPTRCFLVMQDPETRTGIPEAVVRKLPRLFTYLKKYEPQLRARASKSVRNLMDKGAFYSMFAVSDYTFAPFKVVWPWISSKFYAAVVGPTVVIPEHNVFLVSFDRAEEANYFCAAINSLPVGLAITALFAGSGGGMAHSGLLEVIRIPKYRPSDLRHQRLAALGNEATSVSSGLPGRYIAEIEAEIDENARCLWDLSHEEFAAIKDELQEMER